VGGVTDCYYIYTSYMFVASRKGKRHIDKESIVWIIVATLEGSSKTIPYWVLVGFL